MPKRLMPSAAEKATDVDHRPSQAVFAGQTAVAVLLMVVMFVAPGVPGLWPATVSHLLVLAVALAVSAVLFLLGGAWRRWAAVIAVATSVSGIVLMLLEA
jgi:hypothetical protein